VFALVLSVITMVLLFLLAVMRIAEALRGGWRYLITRYDIAGTERRVPQDEENSAAEGAEMTHEASFAKRSSPIYVLFGPSLSRTEFP
jgi:hypothetical protein